MSKPLAMLIVTVFSLNVMIGLGVHCHFTDQTSITENMSYAYRPGMWRQTTMTDFQGAFDGTKVRRREASHCQVAWRAFRPHDIRSRRPGLEAPPSTPSG